MLEEKRIKEAENNVKNYLEEGMLQKTGTKRPEILRTYERNFQESIELAERIFNENSSNLWVIVISYYSMFYISNAVLYKIGYKIGSKVSHKVTSDSLIVFIRNKLKRELLSEYEEAKEEAMDIIGRKTDEIIESYDQELQKRSVFQYESTEEIKRAKAKTSLERAKNFIFEIKKVMASIK